MRKGYLFIRARTRHVAAKVVAASLGLAAIAAAAVPDQATQQPLATQFTSVEFSERPSSAAFMTCADFDNQAEAQAFLADADRGDRGRLDSDNDSIACESLP